jgi:catechol 2,3-dioxygenase-like lactoylglutathione lyase family enzyme
VNAGSPASPAREAVLRASGGFFALSVADLAASTKWYSEKLGLTVVMEVPKKDKVGVTVLEGDGVIVELIQNDNAVPSPRATTGVAAPDLVQGLFKAGLLVDDFDRTLASLKARGVEVAYGPYPARKDQRPNAIIKDNSGNLLQLFGAYENHPREAR